MILIALLASLGLFAFASATVVPKNSYNVTVTEQDILQFNLTDLFTFGANVSCTSLSGSIANYTTSWSVVEDKDISNLHFGDEPEIVQFISNSSIFAVFDNSSVLIQPINLDHESFGIPITKSFGRPGAEAVCTDVAFNKNTNRIFISCFAKQSTKTPNSTLWVYEINGATGDTVNKYSTTLDDKQQLIVHRANIMLVQIRRGIQFELGAIVYDQGISSGMTTTNRWAWVLSGADSDTLASLGVVNLGDTFPLTAVYDMFAHRDGVLITGKNSSTPGDVIKMAYCELAISGQASFLCFSNLVSAPYNTSLGYVGIFNTGQYVEVNANPNNPKADLISICNFGGNFNETDFIDHSSCSSIESFVIPDDVSISVVEGNIHQIVVQYVHYDSTYAGFSLHSFDLKFETKHIDDSLAHHLVPLGKTLIKVNKTDVVIHRMVPPYFFVKAEQLKDGPQTIRVECNDTDSTTPVANFINITKLASMTDGVYLNHDKIPDFSVYEGDHFMFQVTSDIAMGNDLTTTVSLDPKLTNFSTVQVYDTELVNINWKVSNTTTDFQDVHFSGKYAVTLDSKGWISFHVCYFVEIATIHCNEQASYSLAGRDIQLKKDVNAVYGWLFAWAVDKDINNTFVFIFDGKNNVNVQLRRGVASDCAMAENGNVAYQVCAYADIGRIFGYEYSVMNPAEGTPLPEIHIGLSGRDYFCPIDVEFDRERLNTLEVLSVCEGRDQRIITYTYPPSINRITGELELRLTSSVPLNFAYANPQYCSMGSEFVVFSQLNGKSPNLQSLNTVDDRNSWNFGTYLDDLNLGEIRDFNCVPRAGVFSTVSTHSDDPSKVTLAVYWGNNQWQANRKVFKVLREGLQQYKFIDSYEFMGQVIHTLYDPSTHTYDFMVSFTKGAIVDVRLEHGAFAAAGGNGTVSMTIDIRNAKSKTDTITKNLEIVNSSSTVSIKTKKKLEAEPMGVINLEEYLEIKGPVAEVNLKNGSKGVKLHGRLHMDGAYTPAPRDTGVFSNLQTVSYTTVGVRTTEANSSTFIIFTNISVFVGQYAPAHGVNAFHFAPLLSDPDHSIFVAYSTAEPINNTLQFVVLKDGVRVGIGSITTDIFNFSMIRVIQLSSTDQDRFLVLGMNGDEHAIHHFVVSVDKNGRITSTIGSIAPNVHDFGIAAPSASDLVYVIYNVQGDFDEVTIERFKKADGSPVDALKLPLKLNQNDLADNFMNYPVVSLFAKEHNSTAFYVVFNTFSPYIYESLYDTTNFANVQRFTYMKMPGHDGRFMDGNMHNIVMLTFGDLPSGDLGARYVFYNRQTQLNNGSKTAIWTFHNDEPRPFSLTVCHSNYSHFQFASPFDTAPLVFLYLDQMQLNITDNSRLKYAYLEIDAAAHVPSAQINIADIINGGEDDAKKSMAWWPFVLVIGVLILLAVGFIVYKAQKDKAIEADDPENYVSLKTETKEAKGDRD